MSDTVFGKILAGEIPCHRLYEDEKVLAFLDVGPLSEGHALVIPKEPAVSALSASMDPSERNALRDSVMGKARMVAEAAGGFLGLGNKVSAEEQAVLDELAGVFGG